jgi:hypothetical protein
MAHVAGDAVHIVKPPAIVAVAPLKKTSPISTLPGRHMGIEADGDSEPGIPPSWDGLANTPADSATVGVATGVAVTFGVEDPQAMSNAPADTSPRSRSLTTARRLPRRADVGRAIRSRERGADAHERPKHSAGDAECCGPSRTA